MAFDTVRQILNQVAAFFTASNPFNVTGTGTVSGSVKLEDDSIATQKLAIDATGKVGINSLPAITGTVSVSNMIPAIETGLATSAKQLPDGHNVSIAQTTPGTSNAVYVTNTSVAPISAVYNNTHTVPTVTSDSIGSQACNSVVVKSLSTNTAAIYIGASGCTVANGFELSPGEGVSLDVNNVSLVYCISGSAAQNLRWVAV